MKVLLIEDEHRIARAIKEGLEQEKYAVDVVYDGEDGYNAAANGSFDVILCDATMPGMDGFTVVKKLREGGNHTPVIMLTAKDQGQDIVKGLDSGADDYLAKPFSFEVLLARLRTILRRPQDTLGDVLTVADLELDTRKRTVKREGKTIMLSSKEYSILEYLLRNKNQVLSKNNIMTHVWDFDADILPNNVEVFMTYLRGKIEKPFKGRKIIETIRGFGYIIKDDDEEYKA